MLSREDRTKLRPQEKPDPYWDYYPCDWCWELTDATDLFNVDDESVCKECLRATGRWQKKWWQ